MRRSVLVLALSLVAAAAVAQEYERVMLPIAPMTLECNYHSRYDVALVLYNGSDHAIARPCDGCAPLAAKSSMEITRSDVPAPAPQYLYLPASEAGSLRLLLQAASGNMGESDADARFFTELPVVRDSDFRSGKTEFVGVRVDPNWRQALRIYGADGRTSVDVVMRVYSMSTGALLSEETYRAVPVAGANAIGFDAAPSFTMECDLSEHEELIGQTVRVELEPTDPATRYWAFMAVASNRTQHFYTLMPK